MKKSNKVFFNKTWAYEEFIDEDEQRELLSFAHNNVSRLKNNGPGRFYCDFIANKMKPPEVFFNVKNKIIDTEGFVDFKLDPIFGDFLSFNYEGAAIHEHKDNNLEKRIHTRYNLLLSLPHEGGNPIYDGEVITVRERMLWRCEAGKYNHASTSVVGNKPRINISFGFQL